jgi:uncharacterized protein
MFDQMKRETSESRLRSAEAGARLGDWIQTYTGVKFYPFDAREEEIDIRDIAHALSNICRFGGHVREFYSVAQHSILASMYIADRERWGIYGLLHDAAEAYVGDICRPLKRSLMVENYCSFSQIEKDLEIRIFARFLLVHGGLNPYLPEWDRMQKAIKEVDNRLLVTECLQLMAHPWLNDKSAIGDCIDGDRVKRYGVEPIPTVIYPWPPKYAEQQFLYRFNSLCPGFKVALPE